MVAVLVGIGGKWINIHVRCAMYHIDIDKNKIIPLHPLLITSGCSTSLQEITLGVYEGLNDGACWDLVLQFSIRVKGELLGSLFYFCGKICNDALCYRRGDSRENHCVCQSVRELGHFPTENFYKLVCE